MTDAELRALERETQKHPDNLQMRFKFRNECIRLGRYDLCGLEAGDIVIVNEVESPWVRGEWEGVVLRVFEAKDKYVRPTNPESCSFRVKPSKEYLAKGLYLTRLDKAVCKIPRIPGEPIDSMNHPTSEV